MIVCGMKVDDALLLNGKYLIHMTIKFSSLVIIRFVMRLNRISMHMDCSLSFITRICLSIYGTCLLVAVGLICNHGKLDIRKSNY